MTGQILCHCVSRNRHNVCPEDIDRMAREWEDWE